RAAEERLTHRQRTRLQDVFTAHERHIQVEVAWQCAQDLRSVYQPGNPQAQATATKILASFPTCPIPEIARLGRTLNQWREAFLAYFTTNGADNGGTEAINGLIELPRRVARGFRNPHNYRLQMLLIGQCLRI
ncbi:MAG: ISL3 family transposase, partial [Micrococcales bacterium]